MKTRLGLALMGFLGVLAAACAGDDAEDGNVPPPASQAGSAYAFCTEFYRQTCEHLWKCECNELVLESCEYEQAHCEEHPFFVALEEGLAEGWLRYDDAAADRLLARMKDPDFPCVPQWVALGFDSYAGHTLDGSFLGTLPAGSECGDADAKSLTGVTFCAEGHLCLPAADGVSRCVAAAAEGERCPIVPNEPGSSCYERRPADPDGHYDSAHVDLVCVPDSPGSESGTCQRHAPDGNSCSNQAQCASEFCLFEEPKAPGVCSPRLANGEACVEYPQCESGRCDVTADPPTCADAAADGRECLFDEDCESGQCRAEDPNEVFGVCASDVVPGPVPPGSSCGLEDTCDGGLCLDGVCQEPICTEHAE
ncbi:MAG TPA: hypothetical protein VGK73_05025 [Polyangiaceae bacterium]